MKSFFVLIGALFINCVFASNYIVVTASSFTLEVYDEKEDLIASYPVRLGKNRMGKTKEGDQKTPLGEYTILWKASRFANVDGGFLIEDGKAFCTPDNRFVTNYPEDTDEKLWTENYGANQAVVMCLDYPNKSDLEKGYTGGCIEIHSSFADVEQFDSLGCITLRPYDARELYNLVEEGTKVFIYEFDPHVTCFSFLSRIQRLFLQKK